MSVSSTWDFCLQKERNEGSKSLFLGALSVLERYNKPLVDRGWCSKISTI